MGFEVVGEMDYSSLLIPPIFYCTCWHLIKEDPEIESKIHEGREELCEGGKEVKAESTKTHLTLS